MVLSFMSSDNFRVLVIGIGSLLLLILLPLVELLLLYSRSKGGVSSPPILLPPIIESPDVAGFEIGDPPGVESFDPAKFRLLSFRRGEFNRLPLLPVTLLFEVSICW